MSDGYCGVCGRMVCKHTAQEVAECLAGAVSRQAHDRELRLAGTRQVIELLNRFQSHSNHDQAMAALIEHWPEMHAALCELRLDEMPALRARFREMTAPPEPRTLN